MDSKTCKKTLSLYNRYIYTEQKIAWDRYDELKRDDKCHRLSFIAPADDETYKQILNGEWDY